MPRSPSPLASKGRRYRFNYAKGPSSLSASTESSINEDVVEDCDIVVFGGGFGGLYTALAIQQLQQKDAFQKKFNIVFTAIKNAMKMYQSARIGPHSQLIVKIYVRLSPEVKVSFGKPAFN